MVQSTQNNYTTNTQNNLFMRHHTLRVWDGDCTLCGWAEDGTLCGWDRDCTLCGWDADCTLRC